MEDGWDFFLQAHKCLQGTAKPTHYIVIHNEFATGQDALDASALERVVRLQISLLCSSCHWEALLIS